MCLQNHRIRNWSQYNRALVGRGSITYWMSDDPQTCWQYQGAQKPGGQTIYSNEAISVCLLIKEVYSQAYRQTQGLVNSLLKLMNIHDQKSPCYTQLCRRAKSITIKFSTQARSSKNLCALVDSTGIKVYGESEWYGEKHHRKQRQQWRKLHIMIDHATQMILNAELTEAYVHDATHFGALLDDLPEGVELDTIIGDGAYSLNQCHEIIEDNGGQLIAPPHRNSRKHHENRNHRHKPPTPQRDAAIDFVRQYESHEEGLKAWKLATHYHRRSLVETAMFRLKANFGDSVRAKTLHGQRQIMLIRCVALNKMTALGMPAY